jgi:hypothetical protein
MSESGEGPSKEQDQAEEGGYYEDPLRGGFGGPDPRRSLMRPETKPKAEEKNTKQKDGTSEEPVEESLHDIDILRGKPFK